MRGMSSGSVVGSLKILSRSSISLIRLVTVAVPVVVAVADLDLLYDEKTSGCYLLAKI